MAFSFLGWLLGFGLSKAAGKGLDVLQSQTLNTEIDNAIYKWEKKLPKNIRFTYQSLFDSNLFHQKEVPDEVINILIVIEEGKIPSENDWFKMLFYLWKSQKEKLGIEANDFFKLDEKEVAPHLKALSIKLKQTCQLNEKLFKNDLNNKVTDISDKVSEMLPLLKQHNVLFTDLRTQGIEGDTKLSNNYSGLNNSLFLCKTKTNLYLGTSINNSGLIVCGTPKGEVVTEVISLSEGISHKIISSSWNQINFMQIDSDTNGLVLEFVFGFLRFNENLFTFDIDGNRVKVKHVFNHSLLNNDTGKVLMLVLFLFGFQMGLLLAEIQGDYDKTKLMSSPVFNSKKEFVGIGIAAAQFETSQEGSTSNFLIIISSQAYNSFILKKY